MGDIALNAGHMGHQHTNNIKKFGKKYADNWAFSGVKKYFKEIVLGNLESSITSHSTKEFPDKDERFYFHSPPGSENVLKAGGFNVMALANNHVKDSGIEGMLESKKRLQKVGIQAAGVGQNLQDALEPVIIETKYNGATVKTGIIAINKTISLSCNATFDRPGTATGTPEMLAHAVRILLKKVDIVAVSVHWGDYYGFDFPVMPPDIKQKRLAHALIDAGASFIIGHHSHAVGEIELYKNGLIIYSLGEFIFSTRHSRHHPTTIIVEATMTRKGIDSFSVIPVNQNPLEVWYRPQVLNKKLGLQYLSKLIIPKDSKYKNFYGESKK